MSHFSLQLNYFPKQLHNVVAPTDTRRRPDQRALENGDMKSAADHKDRLENLQRAVRKWREENKTEHSPRYFTTWKNEGDGQTYFVYNKLYFEEDRVKQDWQHLPDIFSEEVPAHIEPYIVEVKGKGKK